VPASIGEPRPFAFPRSLPRYLQRRALGGCALRNRVAATLNVGDFNPMDKIGPTQPILMEFHMFKFTSAVLLLLVGTAPLLADDMPVNADAIKWAPVPPFLPAGAKMAVIAGDPSKDGIYVLRLQMPANYKIPAHNHPTSEYVTVLSGDFHIGMGDKLDEAKGMHLTAGGFSVAPAQMNHFAWTTSATIVQVHGKGPFAITYVNPADDPSKK
jgi:hypothetical protein